MENAYVIHLKSSLDRWVALEKSFEGSKFQLHPVNPVHVPQSGGPLKRRHARMRSLVLSFLKIVKMAKRKNLPEILILEDDCFPRSGYEERWKSVKTWLKAHPDEWDIYIGGSVEISDPFYIGSYKEIRFYRPRIGHCSHWVYLHKRSYDSFIKIYESALATGEIVASDSLNAEMKRILSYPFLAYQKASVSTLTKKDTRDSTGLFRKQENSLKRYTTRKLFRPANKKTRRKKPAAKSPPQKARRKNAQQKLNEVTYLS